MRKSLFPGRRRSLRKDPYAREPKFPALAAFRDFSTKSAGFSSKIPEFCKKNAFLWKVCRPSPWKIKNNSYYWCIWRRTQVGKGRLCKSPIPQFESERCLLKKTSEFSPVFFCQNCEKKFHISLGAQVFNPSSLVWPSVGAAICPPSKVAYFTG